jgi:hypothetical protein
MRMAARAPPTLQRIPAQCKLSNHKAPELVEGQPLVFDVPYGDKGNRLCIRLGLLQHLVSGKFIYYETLD